MKAKRLMPTFVSILLVLLLLVIAAIWFIRPYIPYAGGATSHFETPPLMTDTRWVTTAIAHPSVSASNTPITAQNSTQLTETARWEGFTSRDVVYSADGSIIAVITALGPYLYDAETLTLIRHIETHRDVKAAVFSPDTRLIALALDDHNIYIHSVVDGTLVNTLEGHTSFIQQLSFDATGELLASAAWDNTARIWSVADGTLVQTFTGHEDYVQGIALQPDGTHAVTVSYDGTVRVWRVEDGAEIRVSGKPFLFDFMHFIGNIDSKFYYHRVALSPDGRTLAAQDSSGYIYLWEFPNGRLLRALKGKYAGPGGRIQFATNTLLITEAGEQWDVTQGVAVRDFNNTGIELYHIIPSPDGEYVAVMDAQDHLGIWRTSDGHFVKGLWTEGASAFPYGSIALAPDGKILFLGNHSGEVEIRRLPDGDLLDTLPHSDMTVEHLAVSPDGAYLAVGTTYTYLSDVADQGVVRVWSVADSTLLYELSGHQSVYDLAFSPDSTLLATSGSDENYEYPIRVWDMRDGSLVNELRGHDSRVDYVHFSEDGRELFSLAYKNPLRKWNISTGDSVAISDPVQYNNQPVFSPDGTLLVSRFSDNFVSIRSLTDSTEQILEHDDFSVWSQSILFNPDATLLATGTSSGNLYLWRVADGTLLQKIPAHTNNLTTLAYSPDGTMLVTVGWDNTLRFWQIQEP